MGAGINLENLIFADYTGKNLIIFSQYGGEYGYTYNINLKNVEVNFRASGAFYGYCCDDGVINVENCVFNADVAGNCILNFTNSMSYLEATLNLKDTVLNELCGITNTAAQYATVNEEYSSDAAAIAAKIKIRLGATEGGKVGEVYFRSIDAATLKALPAGTKITVFCKACGETQEVASLTCQTEVTCTCGVKINRLADHAYTEATCQTKSKCEWCNTELGTLASHHYSAATCSEKSKCTVCGEETGNLLRHKDRNADGICDSCNFNINGDTSTTTGSNNSGNNVTTTAPANNAEEKKGCGGTVTVAGLALVAALGSCAIFVEKKRR
jgi:hypothetical protein